MLIKDEKGLTWFVNNVKTDENAPIYDTGKGPEAIIRMFTIQTDPNQEVREEEILNFHKPSIERKLFEDGWMLDRELTIEKQAKGLYIIFAVAKLAPKHGGKMAAMNDSPKIAQDILQKKTNLL